MFVVCLICRRRLKSRICLFSTVFNFQRGKNYHYILKKWKSQIILTKRDFYGNRCHWQTTKLISCGPFCHLSNSGNASKLLVLHQKMVLFFIEESAQRISNGDVILCLLLLHYVINESSKVKYKHIFKKIIYTDFG